MSSTVWLRSYGKVIGVNIDWLNERIDEYNKNPYLVSEDCFWEWLSWSEDEKFYGLSFLNMDTSCIHTIRRARK